MSIALNPPAAKVDGRSVVARSISETLDRCLWAILEYTEVFYPRERPHSSLDYRSPTQYEDLHEEERILP